MQKHLPIPATTPALYGIHRSNRDFSNAYYWGKNQFNSSFPVALACYMRDQGHPAVYVSYKDSARTAIGEIAVEEVFGSTRPNAELFFSFETRFDAFHNVVHDEPPSIDLVICEETRAAQIRPLEIKLTTLPDNTTESLAESEYGSELVIRSATTRYMAMQMMRSVATKHKRVREIFEPVFAKVRAWDSKLEMLKLAPNAVVALETFLAEFRRLEQPLLIQPIWKTVGKSPQLAPHCLDIFTWSDFALSHLFLESARDAANGVKSEEISRQLRAALRLARFLYECARSGKTYQAPIYDEMTFDKQSDKEFAISGTRSHRLMTCPRLTQPLIHKDEVKNIILGGGQKFLSPERRFDAILYFSTDLF